MGADMIATAMLLPVDENGHLLDDATTHDLFTTALVDCDESALDRAIEYLDEALDDPDLGEPLKDHVRGLLQEAIDRLFGPNADCVRELTTLWVRGMPMLVTGGMSWGDSPTEALELVSLLNAANLIPELQRNRPADKAGPDYITMRFT